jgi:ribosomal protein L11 methyltransferase
MRLALHDGQASGTVPYRIEVSLLPDDALDRLVDLGALDVEALDEGGLAALMPDSVPPERVAAALGIDRVDVSPALGRDADSIWLLRPRPVRIGRLLIVPADLDTEPGALRLIDAPAFGTGLHPTTALCVEIMEGLVQAGPPAAVLDVGTGSGVLALAALTLGVPRATGIDIDGTSLEIAARNARLNGLEARLRLEPGGPEAIAGAWPLVLANVLAAPLVEMAPALVRRVGHHGRLVLSGIPSSVEQEVDRAYRRLGMRRLSMRTRGGWVALLLQASW